MFVSFSSASAYRIDAGPTRLVVQTARSACSFGRRQRTRNPAL